MLSHMHRWEQQLTFNQEEDHIVSRFMDNCTTMQLLFSNLRTNERINDSMNISCDSAQLDESEQLYALMRQVAIEEDRQAAMEG